MTIHRTSNDHSWKLFRQRYLLQRQTQLPLKGKGHFKVEIAGISTDHCFTVAELSVDEVYGIDFLKRHCRFKDVVTK